jgi:hypothetical protein
LVAGRSARVADVYCLERLFLRLLREDSNAAPASAAPPTHSSSSRSSTAPAAARAAGSGARQAAAFGLSVAADDGAERDALRALAVHCLVDLTGRHGDGARRLVGTQGGPELATALLREAPAWAASSAAAAAGATPATGPSGGFGTSAASVRTSGRGGHWKRTRPLHLLLNCSTLPALQPAVCAQALGDLVRATFARPSDHADGVNARTPCLNACAGSRLQF